MIINGNDSIQSGFDVAVAEQYAAADFVGADLAAVHPVGERNERYAQTVGGFVAREVLRVGFRMCGTKLSQADFHEFR